MPQFTRIYRQAVKNIQQEKKDQLLPPAFSFYLEHIAGSQGKTKGWSFAKMLEEIGLKDKQESSQAADKMQAKQALEKANRIRELDKKQKGK